MKAIFKISFVAVFLAALCLGPSASSQDDGYGVFVPISKYMASGDAEKLSAWFSNNLEMTVEGQEGNASKTQAKLIMSRFFSTHTPTSFTIVHKTGRANMKYALGRYVSGGEQYDVTLFVSISGDEYRIKQIKIEKSE